MIECFNNIQKVAQGENNDAEKNNNLFIWFK